MVLAVGWDTGRRTEEGGALRQGVSRDAAEDFSSTDGEDRGAEDRRNPGGEGDGDGGLADLGTGEGRSSFAAAAVGLGEGHLSRKHWAVAAGVRREMQRAGRLKVRRMARNLAGEEEAAPQGSHHGSKHAGV